MPLPEFDESAWLDRALKMQMELSLRKREDESRGRRRHAAILTDGSFGSSCGRWRMKTNPDPVRRSARYVAKACSAIRMLYCCVPFTTPKSSMKANTDDGLQKTRTAARTTFVCQSDAKCGQS